MKHINFHSCINFYSCIDFHLSVLRESGEIGRLGIVVALPVALWAVFHLPQLERHDRLADGVRKASNFRDSPSVQLVVSLGKKAASVFKNEALPDIGEHIVANGFVPSDSIALID